MVAKKSINVILPKIKVDLDKEFHIVNISPGLVERRINMQVILEGSTPYRITRQLSRFIELERELVSFYSLSRFPVLSSFLPLLDHRVIEEHYFEFHTKDCDIINMLQAFLSGVVSKPEFMCEPVLDFLEIHKTLKYYFGRYVNKMEMKGSIKENESRELALSLMDIKPILIDQKPLELLDISKIRSLVFTGKKVQYYHSEVKNETMYVFEIKRWENEVCVHTWRIAKSFLEFVLNHKKIEWQVYKSFPDVKTFIPKNSAEAMDNSPESLERIMEGLEKYLIELFTRKKLYCVALIEFLELDPITLERDYRENEVDLLLQLQTYF